MVELVQNQFLRFAKCNQKAFLFFPRCGETPFVLDCCIFFPPHCLSPAGVSTPLCPLRLWQIRRPAPNHQPSEPPLDSSWPGTPSAPAPWGERNKHGGLENRQQERERDENRARFQKPVLCPRLSNCSVDYARPHFTAFHHLSALLILLLALTSPSPITPSSCQSAPFPCPRPIPSSTPVSSRINPELSLVSPNFSSRLGFN